MSIVDGNPVDAPYTNSALASKQADNNLAGKQTLSNTDTESGVQIDNLQQKVNEIGDSIGYVGEGDATNDDYANENVIANGDNRKEAIEKLDQQFDPSTGHEHDGVDSPRIQASNIEGLNVFDSAYQSKEVASVSGSSTDVSTEFGADTPGGASAVEGVITSAPLNTVQLVETNTGQELEDNTGKRIFGRITEAAGVWTLSYFVLNAGSEVSASISGPIDISVYYREVFGPTSPKPTITADVGRFDSLNATADILDASPTTDGKMTTGAQTLAGNKNFQDGLEVGGIGVVDLSSAQTVTGKTINNSGIGGGTPSTSNFIQVPSDTRANLEALPRKKGALYFDNDDEQYVGDDGTDLIDIGSGGEGGVQTNWATETGITIEGSTTNPTKPSTVDREDIIYRRIGGDLVARYVYRADSTSGSAAGSGDYIFTLPAGLSFDAGLVDFYTTPEGSSTWRLEDAYIVGYAVIGDGGGTGSFLDGYVVPYDDNRFRIFGTVAGSSPARGAFSSFFFPLNFQEVIQIYIDHAPIDGWSSVGGAIGDTMESTGITIEGTTTNPTKGTITKDVVQSQIIGDQASLKYIFRQSTAGTAGSGEYLISLPAGVSFNTSFVDFYTGTGTGFNDASWRSYGNANFINDGVAFNTVSYIIPYDANRFRILTNSNTGGQGYFGSSFFALNQSTFGFTAEFRVPVA